MSENKTTRKDDPMDVDALSKGSGKGKSEGKGKKGKGQNHMSNGSCWNCGKTAVKCGGQDAKAKAKCKVTNILMDGLGKVTNKLMGGGRRQTGREDLVQDGE